MIITKPLGIDGSHCHKVSVMSVASCSLAKRAFTESIQYTQYKPAVGGQHPTKPFSGRHWVGGELHELFFYFLEATLHIQLKHLVLPQSAALPSITGAEFAFIYL